MKKILTTLLILCIISFTSYFVFLSMTSIKFTFNESNFTNKDMFNAYPDEIKNLNGKKLVIEGLDLLGFTDDEILVQKGYIKEFGLFTVVYKVYDVDNEDTLVYIECREINVTLFQSNKNNLILNEDFSANLYKWNITDITNDLSYETSNNELSIIQNGTGDEFWHQKLSQNIVLQENSSYTLTFDAKSTLTKQIEVSLIQDLHDSPWSYNYGLIEYLEISNTNNTFTIDFDFVLPTELDGFKIDLNNIKLEIKFGNLDYLNNSSNSVITFSNFSLTIKQ